MLLQVTRPSSAPVVCTLADGYVAATRARDVTIDTYVITEINCLGAYYQLSVINQAPPANTHALVCLHWLRIPERIEYKIALAVAQLRGGWRVLKHPPA